MIRVLGSLILLSVAASMSFAAEVGMAPATSRAASERPSFDELRAAAEKQFSAVKDYKAGDLITQSQVRAVFDDFAERGWKVRKAGEIAPLVPSDVEFLTIQLQTPHGKRFMRAVATVPGGYDRLDRLSRLPQGEQIVKDLSRAAGGEKFVHYLASAKGGASLGKMLAKDSGGADFNKPTGRIYTAQQLLLRLEVEYRLEETATR